MLESVAISNLVVEFFLIMCGAFFCLVGTILFMLYKKMDTVSSTLTSIERSLRQDLATLDRRVTIIETRDGIVRYYRPEVNHGLG